MAKNSVTDWSTTASSNTDIAGINIDEGCAPSGINNAIRAMMAQIKSGVGVLASANTWTADQTISGSDPGANGPIVTLFHDSASPAVSDTIGQVRFNGKDSGGNTTTYARVLGFINDTTDTSEDGSILLQAITAGSLTTVATLNGISASFTVPVRGAAGTVGTPAISFTGDTDTGFWEDTAGRLSVAVDGAYIGYWNSTGWTLTSSAPTVATTFGSVNAVKNLLSGGGQIDVTNTTGGSCMRLSRASGSDGTVESFHYGATSVGTVSVTAAATAYNTSSDERIKENFREIDSGVLIDAINVYEFDFIEAYGGGVGYGVKAQELYEVLPQAVTVGNNEPVGSDDFQPWGVDYAKLVPILLQEIKGLRQRLDAAGL